jgi:amino acid adenylation domain-containing protein
VIPIVYFPVNEIPLGSTGKVDRRRLREMGSALSWKEIVKLQSTILSVTEFCEPSNNVERQLCQIWAKALGLDPTRISTTDSFLRLGGDSVAAMHLVAAARENNLLLTVANIFKNPILSDLARVIKLQTISHDNYAIAPFSLLSGSKNQTAICKAAARLCGIGIAEIEDVYPCTSLQQGMLAMTARNEGVPYRERDSSNYAADYISRIAFELPGQIKIKQFQRAWTTTVVRAPITRTRIVDLPGEGLVQVVVSSPIPLHSYPRISDSLEYAGPMGLGTPLCRAGFVTGDQNHFVLEMHHAIFDGWCTMLILDALEAAYHETHKILQPLAPFQPFIKHVLAADSPEASIFWREQLAGSEATIFPSPNYHPEKKLDLDHSISGLQWLREGITPTTVVRSALAMLLASYTNSNDVKYGATVSGRQASVPDIEQIAGPTIATIPVRVKFDWDQTVETLQQQIQRQAVEATEYEQLGLQHIQRIDKEVEKASQFQLLLVIQPVQRGTSQKAGGLFSQANSITDSMSIYNSFALMIICQLEESGLRLKINYDSGAIEQKEVQRIALQLEHLIRQLCTEQLMTSKLRDITSLNKEDLIDIWGWNRAVPEAVVEPVTDLIDSIAATHPEVFGISGWDRQLTYQQLKDLSMRLACRLREEGVGPRSIVVLSFEKSSWMSVSMISALRLGAIALPISAPTSNQRAREIVETLQPKLAIASNTSDSSSFHGLIPTFHISELVEPNDEAYVHVLQPHEILPSDPALILFTSGSTGAPKSILWSHSALASNIRAASIAFGLTASSRVFQFAGYEFDVSTVEALSTLSVGGCLCIPSESDRTNRLAGVINDANANWMCLTPSVSETLSPGDLPSLRTLVFAGEKLQHKTAFKWAKGLDFVYNWYGPAEASVASSYTVEQDAWTPGMIGRSQYGVTWLVDPKDSNTLAPIGAIAELCIEGPILASYVGDSGPSLNEKCFFSPRWLHRGHHETVGRHGQLYRTGDLVKYDTDGRIIFIGRSQESQRKLRGQRVELSQIELCVQSFLSGKFEVTVVAEIFTLSNNDNETLALFISHAGAADSAEGARTFIKRFLPVDELEAELQKFVPSYMIPKLYIPIAKIPTNHSGKTDRRRLRQIGSSFTSEQLAETQPSRHAARKPSTDMEKRLQQLWAEIIGIEADAIYANDNFLRLGSDSIGAMRLVALARNQGLLLSVTDVFEVPQLEDMAKRIRQDSSSPAQEVPPFSLLGTGMSEAETRSYAARLCSIPESRVIDVYPCTALQEGLLALGARRHGQYVSRSVLGLQPTIDTYRLKRAWQTTVEKLPILRTRIIDIPGQGLVQVVLDDTPWRSGGDVDTYLREDEREPMGLGTELCRAAIIDHSFIFTIHHCTYDGNSLKMVLDELELQYLDKEGMTVTPFQNFIEHLNKIDPQEAAAFWGAQLSNSELRQFPVLPSPTYEPQANEDLDYPISLDWPRTGMTPSTIIRSAWAVLTAQYTSSSNVIFGVTVSGRQADMRGVENCVAPTISTVPIAVSIDWDETIEAFLKRLQHQTIEITPYEQYGLQNIQRTHGELDSGLFQTLLVVQPVAEGKSLHEDSSLFKARTFSSNIDTRGTDPFNTHALMLICELTKTGLHIQMSFDRNIIERKQIHRIACQFETIIQQLCMNNTTTTKLDAVQTASGIDLDLFWTQNAELPEVPNKCVHDLITLAAEKQPNEVAIDAWDGQFSYQQVDQLSTVLCQNLIALGLTKGSIVALCFEKTKWVPLAQIAVFKAGGVALLQSVVVPDHRVGSVFKNLGVQLALASESRLEVVSQYARCLTIDQLMECSRNGVPANLPVLEMSDSAAILVSSGSTGEPKQISWSHRALAANVKGHSERVAMNVSFRVFQFSSYDFDVSTLEMLSALVNMGRLCIPSESERLDGMAAAINRFGANYIIITPSTAKLLRPEEVPTLCTLALAGEGLVQEDVDRWKGKCHVINW